MYTYIYTGMCIYIKTYTSSCLNDPMTYINRIVTNKTNHSCVIMTQDANWRMGHIHSWHCQEKFSLQGETILPLSVENCVRACNHILRGE